MNSLRRSSKNYDLQFANCDRQTDRHTDRHTDIQADRETDRQTARQPCILKDNYGIDSEHVWSSASKVMFQKVKTVNIASKIVS